MKEDKTFSSHSGYEPLNDKSEGTDVDCSILEEDFPYIEKCFIKTSSIIGTGYKEICPHCSIWASLPDGENLTVTHFLACSLYGYDKRMKE